ncbi:flotillin domain protein [Phycomyces nitens]|nr:flotillin domain protein [Phycomyces nitens]
MPFYYKVSNANQYIVKTGVGIPDIELVKKGWVFPGQHATVFDVTPQNFSLSIHAMTIEKLEFLLPAVFTIGPKLDIPSLEKYARLLAGNSLTSNAISDLVRGVIEGETRVIAAGMTIEEIFRERRTFKDMVVKNVQSELDHFGVFIYNANIKSLQDTPGSEYFSYLRQKTQEGAVNQAKVDVAEARFRGDVGAKEKEGLTRQNTQRIEADTVVYENERKADILKAQAILKEKSAEYDRGVQMAQIEAQQQTASREQELKRMVEEKRSLAETERLRATVVAKAKAEYEISVQKANAEQYNKERIAEAELFRQQKEAEGIKISAEAKLFKANREAEGVINMLNAQAAGLAGIVKAFGGDNGAALQYLMLEKNTFQELAKTNADAIRGLNPKISVWNTGDSSKGQQNPLSDIYKNLAPTLLAVQEQTGISPKWGVNMPPSGPSA